MRHLILALTFFAAVSFGGDFELTKHADRVDVKLDGKPFTALYFGPDASKPYIHPVRAADWTQVSRSYPMVDNVPGEAHDHPHHRGLWFTHGDVNGFDFWGNEASYDNAEKKGKILLDKMGKVGDGKIAMDLVWRTNPGETLLKEARTIAFSREGDKIFIDFDINLTAVADSVKFGDTKEGSFAVRVATTMRVQTPDKKPGKGVIVNAEGGKGEKGAWGKPSVWVDYSGPVNDKIYGIAILDHPSNPRHPSHWHVRDYGLFAANIFGEHDFYNDPKRDGSLTLKKGDKLRFRYRVAIHPGDAAAGDIDALYKSWAK